MFDAFNPGCEPEVVLLLEEKEELGQLGQPTVRIEKIVLAVADERSHLSRVTELVGPVEVTVQGIDVGEGLVDRRTQAEVLSVDQPMFDLGQERTGVPESISGRL